MIRNPSAEGPEGAKLGNFPAHPMQNIALARLVWPQRSHRLVILGLGVLPSGLLALGGSWALCGCFVLIPATDLVFDPLSKLGAVKPCTRIPNALGQ